MKSIIFLLLTVLFCTASFAQTPEVSELTMIKAEDLPEKVAATLTPEQYSELYATGYITDKNGTVWNIYLLPGSNQAKNWKDSAFKIAGEIGSLSISKAHYIDIMEMSKQGWKNAYVYGVKNFWKDSVTGSVEFALDGYSHEWKTFKRENKEAADNWMPPVISYIYNAARLGAMSAAYTVGGFGRTIGVGVYNALETAAYAGVQGTLGPLLRIITAPVLSIIVPVSNLGISGVVWTWNGVGYTVVSNLQDKVPTKSDNWVFIHKSGNLN